MIAYDWPGNLRELARVIEARTRPPRATGSKPATSPPTIRGHLGAAYLPPPLPTPITPLDELLMQVERRLIEHAMNARARTSRAPPSCSGISRPRLYRRIKELNLPDEPEPCDELTVTPNGLPRGPDGPRLLFHPLAVFC